MPIDHDIFKQEYIWSEAHRPLRDRNPYTYAYT